MKNRKPYIIILTAVVMLLYIPGAAMAGKITGTVKVRGLRSPANILVYVTQTPPNTVDVSNAKFVMDQQNLTFRPHILPIPVGASVLFPNNDKVDHNVFSMSLANKFNLGNYKPGESKSVTFDKPGLVELRCDLHAEMLAYILVMKSPYFAVTDDQGRFEIPDTRYLKTYGITGVKDLPAGDYSVKTWHEKLKTGRQKVTVPASGAVTIEWNLKRGTPGAIYKR